MPHIKILKKMVSIGLLVFKKKLKIKEVVICCTDYNDFDSIQKLSLGIKFKFIIDFKNI